MKRVQIQSQERAFVMYDGVPSQYLGPGTHFVWDLFGRTTVQRFDTSALLAQLTPEQIALVPKRDLTLVQVGENERAVVYLRNEPTIALSTGSHAVWTTERVEGRDGSVAVKVKKLHAVGTAGLTADELALFPASDVLVVELGEFERAVVFERGRPVRWLSAGVHQLWTVERVAIGRGDTQTFRPVTVVSKVGVAGVETPPLPQSIAALANKSDYVETTVSVRHRALRYVDGKLDAVLPAGRHAAWSVERAVHFAYVDMAEQILQVSGQEVMTKDRVSLRLSLSAVWKVADVERQLTVARDPSDVLYRAVQLAAREAVATRTLDELLAAREALSEELEPQVAERAESLGLTLVELGVKDIVLPGEMKALLNKVIEAKKQAEANVILRREETAATRALAQTAKVLEASPVLLRLKELEAYKDLAAKVGHVDLVFGGPDGLEGLKLR